jgi:hypothetical protein
LHSATYKISQKIWSASGKNWLEFLEFVIFDSATAVPTKHVNINACRRRPGFCYKVSRRFEPWIEPQLLCPLHPAKQRQFRVSQHANCVSPLQWEEEATARL